MYFKQLTQILFVIAFVFQSAFSQTVSTVVPGATNINDGLAVAPGGVIYGSNFFNGIIYEANLDGSVSTFYTDLGHSNALQVDSDGNIYTADFQRGIVYKIDPSKNRTEIATGINEPSGLLFTKNQDTLFVTSYKDSEIYTVVNGVLSTYSTDSKLNGPVGLAQDDNGNLYTGNFNDTEIYRIASDGTATLLANVPGINLGFITYAKGYLYGTILDRHRVYRISLTGEVTPFAGTGSAGNTDGDVSIARFNGPNGIAASRTGDTLYVSDFQSRRLRMITNIVTGIEDEESVLQTEFKLHQNYPNPFNPKTTIPFTLAKSGTVNLSIFSINGEKVVSILNQKMAAGNHSVDFDAEKLSTGIYFIKMTVGNLQQTQKMVLMK